MNLLSRVAARTLVVHGMIGVASLTCAIAQQGDEDVRYGYENATLDRVADAPGIPDASFFAEAGPAGDVSLSNGNLHLLRQLGFKYPMERGTGLEIQHVFDSTRIDFKKVYFGPGWSENTPGGQHIHPYYRALFGGRGWTGVGWTLLGGRAGRAVGSALGHRDVLRRARRNRRGESTRRGCRLARARDESGQCRRICR